MFEILERDELADGTVILNKISAPLIAKKAKPGQFVVLKANETGERIPLTLADTDAEQGTLTIIYQVVGKSTFLFKSLQVGDHYQNIIGPLGRPTDIEKLGTVVCVGGGTGVAVVHSITRGLEEIGNHVIAIIGARTKDLIILEDQMKMASNKLHVCTDHGSYGHHGFVTDVLRDILEKEDVKLVVGAGPVPMMKFLCKVTAEFNVKTFVSLNPIMVDGTGMCGCCRVAVGGETKFACVDGPEFNGHEVDFDELIQRLQAYKEEEALAYEKSKCECKAD